VTTALPLEMEELLSWLGVERGRSANTLAAYRRDLAAYSEFLTGRGLTPAMVTESVVEDYLAFLRAAGRAPASVARALVSVRALHRFLEDEGQAPTNPAGDVHRPKVPSGLPKALSEAEVLALLGAVTGDDPVARRDRAILEVLYGCGLRVSELVGLSLADLDLGSSLLRAFGKGSKERVVPVGRPACEALAAWLSPRGRGELEPDRRAGRPPVAPRPPALLRDPHARPRGGHPGGAGVARPRVDLDHPGVHEGVGPAAAPDLRGGPSTRQAEGTRVGWISC
jgi:integrase/recombinase XerD